MLFRYKATVEQKALCVVHFASVSVLEIITSVNGFNFQAFSNKSMVRDDQGLLVNMWERYSWLSNFSDVWEKNVKEAHWTTSISLALPFRPWPSLLRWASTFVRSNTIPFFLWVLKNLVRPSLSAELPELRKQWLHQLLQTLRYKLRYGKNSPIDW